MLISRKNLIASLVIITFFGEPQYIMLKPLYIMLPKRSASVKRCDEQTKWMCFLIKDNDLEK